LPELPDVNGNDINAKPNLNFLAIQSRLTGKITGPDALGAKTSALMEGAFFGHSDGDVNGFRLRHAYGIMGISSFALISADPATDHREYAPLSSMAVWSEIHTNGEKLQFGLFGGYTKNLGAGNEIDNSIKYGTRSDIDFVYRVSPRIIFNAGKLRFAGEVEYTTAAYGTFNNMGEVEMAVPVSNTRFLVAAYYFF